MIEKIINDVDENQNKILSNFDYESIVIYSFLKSEYEKGNILNNSLFQFVFRSFYGLDNAGLSIEMKNRYFNLLEEKQTNLEIILSELYEIPTLKRKKTIQFSFATKLVHTIDNNKPIYSSEIGSRINKKPNQTGHKNVRIQSCIVLYNSLEMLYEELKKNEKIRNVISKFRLKFKVNEEKMSDTKVLDFILWSLGKLKNLNDN